MCGCFLLLYSASKSWCWPDNGKPGLAEANLRELFLLLISQLSSSHYVIRHKCNLCLILLLLSLSGFLTVLILILSHPLIILFLSSTLFPLSCLSLSTACVLCLSFIAYLSPSLSFPSSFPPALSHPADCLYSVCPLMSEPASIFSRLFSSHCAVERATTFPHSSTPR